MMRHAISTVGGLAMATLLTTGCMTREETIHIQADGSARVTYEIEGDEEDILAGDRLPSEPGWILRDESRKDPSGDGERIMVWSAEFDDLNAYPPSFALPQDPHHGAFLRWETSLKVENEPGRTLYRFTRRYIGRRAGKFQEMQQLFVPEELLALMDEKGEQALTSEERETLFSGLAKYEAAALVLRIRDALGRAVAEGMLTLEQRRPVLENLEKHLEEELNGGFLEHFLSLADEQQELELLRLRRELGAHLERWLPRGSADEILFLVENEELAFDVTEDLSDELFSLTVELPGTVIFSNAFNTEENRVTWEFEGKDLEEGDLVLTAVSILEED